MPQPVSSHVQGINKLQPQGKILSENAFEEKLKTAGKKNMPDCEPKSGSLCVEKFVSELETAQKRLDEIIKLSLSGKTFSPQELLALQAQAYRFAQELELTGKVVEKTTSGVKETMRTNI